MGDIVAAKPTESSPSSIQCPMLNSTNYTVWAIKMNMALKVHKVWETIEPGTGDIYKNNMATALLFQSIPETLTLQIGALETSKEVWEEIRTRGMLERIEYEKRDFKP